MVASVFVKPKLHWDAFINCWIFKTWREYFNLYIFYFFIDYYSSYVLMEKFPKGEHVLYAEFPHGAYNTY